MRNHAARIPFESWQQGLVLRLTEPADGLREGLFLFLSHGPDAFTVCRLGEDETGELCETDEVASVDNALAGRFSPLMALGQNID